jgi:hypothetical protein
MSLPNPTVRRLSREAERVTAYHEAGHVVVAFQVGVGLKEEAVTIVPTADCHRSVCTISELKNLGAAELTDEMRLEAERHALVSLAGVVAQKKPRPSSVRNYHSSPDYHNAVNLMSHFMEGEVLEAYLNYLVLRTMNLVALPHVWMMIESLAAVLLEKRALTREQVEQVLRLCVTRGDVRSTQSSSGPPWRCSRA